MDEPAFTVEQTTVDGARHVAPRGELDMATVPQLQAVLDDAMGAGGEVVVDLDGLSFMDSSGIALLSAAVQRAARTGCAVQLRNPQPAVRRLFEIVRLDHALGIAAGPE